MTRPRIRHQCQECKPPINFDREEDHKLHMQRVHGVNFFFRDLSDELKKRSATALSMHISPNDPLSHMDSKMVNCNCKLLPQEKESKLAAALHQMIAGHVKVSNCIICGIAMFDELLPYHYEHNCDD